MFVFLCLFLGSTCPGQLRDNCQLQGEHWLPKVDIMAWGYWTTYSAYTVRQPGQENQQALSPPTKRERSVESREHVETNQRLHQGSFGGGGGSVFHKPYQTHHVEAEKVAFERKLLLGDPDWSSRTIADRNTLPRKKPHDYERTSTSQALYGKNGHSPATTPIDSVSRKSDDTFCPACAQHSASQPSNNRDSRVSFGSVASSSRGSSSARGGSAAVPIPIRSRSRSHDEDERSCCSQHGGGGGGGGASSRTGNFSSSLPTPPPPPFTSQRDLLHHHHASLMETINQKISILSSFKPKFHFMHNTHTPPVAETQNYPSQVQNHTQTHHRRSASAVRPSSGDYVVGSLDHSSLHNGSDRRCRINEGGQHKSTHHQSGSRSGGRKSGRKNSEGTRTPRGHSGSASSRRSRESIGSYERKLIVSSNNPCTSSGIPWLCY